MRHRRTFVFVLLGCLAISLICVAYPIYVIWPFRHQGAGELAIALLVSRYRPILTALAAIAAVLALAGYCPSGRGRGHGLESCPRPRRL